MPKRITADQRRAVLELLAQGHDRQTIAARVGVTPAQVSAVSAHVTMGTYHDGSDQPPPDHHQEPSAPSNAADVLDGLRSVSSDASSSPVMPILIGTVSKTCEGVFWNPDPATGAANPHVLVIGESGFGKTYSICCILTELAQQGIPSIVFDYAQGFSQEAVPDGFSRYARPIEFDAAHDGISINPLQPFPFDLHGPISVAQRVADTFQRVYPSIGVQQHAVLRQAVVDLFSSNGGAVAPDRAQHDRPPAFAELRDILDRYASQPDYPQRNVAASVASHISTVFVFNTFRSNGRPLAWPDVVRPGGSVFVIKLRGLEHSLEKVVTEFLLWNFIGFVESLGPGPLRCYVALDEAHKLSFDAGSPAEKLLREGRKFGLGLILASQQPDDFSPVAFANTATKLVFQVGDEYSAVSRQLHRKVRNARSFSEIYETITKLPRGYAYVVTENIGRVTQIENFQARSSRWT